MCIAGMCGCEGPSYFRLWVSGNSEEVPTLFVILGLDPRNHIFQQRHRLMDPRVKPEDDGGEVHA